MRFGEVTLITEDPPLRVRGLLDGPATLSEGGSMWDVVDRPKRTGVPVWRGHHPDVMVLPLLLDGWMGHRSVEPMIANLERMARKVASQGRAPVVRVEGPVPRGPRTLWVISGLVPGENVIRSMEDDDRLRQDFSVTLLQFIEGDVLIEKAPALRARERSANKTRAEGGRKGSRGASAKAYVVREGDTLSAIAARQLGDHRRWTEISALNRIRDPRNIKVGQELRLP